MASVYEEIQLGVPAAAAWDVIRDIGNVHIRLVPGYAAKVILDGNQRILTMANGNTVREIILDVNEAAYRLAYRVVDTVMPLDYHHASFQVFPVDNAACKLVWITDFLPNHLDPEVRARVIRGAQVIKSTIEKGAEALNTKSAP
jgi:hypothetical protein